MKKIFGILLRTLSISYTLFALLYGGVGISVKLTSTINFPSVEAARAARVVQIAIFTPYIVLGVILLTLLIIHYVVRGFGRNEKKHLLYGIVVTIVGGLIFLGTIAISIIIKETSLLMCYIPAFLLLIYGIYALISSRKMQKL